MALQLDRLISSFSSATLWQLVQMLSMTSTTFSDDTYGMVLNFVNVKGIFISILTTPDVANSP